QTVWRPCVVSGSAARGVFQALERLTLGLHTAHTSPKRQRVNGWSPHASPKAEFTRWRFGLVSRSMRSLCATQAFGDLERSRMVCAQLDTNANHITPA